MASALAFTLRPPAPVAVGEAVLAGALRGGQPDGGTSAGRVAVRIVCRSFHAVTTTPDDGSKRSVGSNAGRALLDRLGAPRTPARRGCAGRR